MRAVGYVNAGTVEFLRADDGTFYFLEVNARLQVEHPVTEEVFGLDLVRLQIEISAGGRLPFTQEGLRPRGHAIECRIVAEDPTRGFLPSPGTIRRLRVPSGPGIRHDGGTYEGWTVPVHYDPMLAKLVAWGSTRQVAVERRLVTEVAEDPFQWDPRQPRFEIRQLAARDDDAWRLGGQPSQQRSRPDAQVRAVARGDNRRQHTVEVERHQHLRIHERSERDPGSG